MKVSEKKFFRLFQVKIVYWKRCYEIRMRNKNAGHKLVYVARMVVDSLLPPAKGGPNDHWKNAPRLLNSDEVLTSLFVILHHNETSRSGFQVFRGFFGVFHKF